MKHIYDTIILGGGPAGYSAALYTARAELDTLVIEKLSAGGQMALTDIIDNYPGFEEGIDGFSLGMKIQLSAERFGAKTEYAEVLSVDFSDEIKIVKTTNGEFYAKTIIIATGANPRELGIENEQALTGNGVHYCAHCDGRFYKDKTVIIVGGGNSAAADALYLSRIAKKVYLVHRRDSLRATKLYHKPLLEAENIEFLWNSKVTKFIWDNRVKGVQISNVSNGNTKNIACDGVFIAIGRKPATEIFKGKLEIDKNGYIIAGENTKTTVDGVFAAGDVRTKQVRQVVTAVSDGAVAAISAEEYLSL